MKHGSKIAAAALLGMGALTMTATTASAAILCNGAGECWHTKNRYSYKPEFGVVVHPNNWHWGAHDHYIWREHSGRGYWRNGAWVTF